MIDYINEPEQQSILSQNESIGVAEFIGLLNQNLKRLRVTVEGEITGRVNRRGAVTYFSIHDHEDDAVLQCMGFNSILDKLGIELEAGMSVKITGSPEIWKRTGSFSFKAFGVQLTGEGTLLKQFEALKMKLEMEGLFKEEHKKVLPQFVKNVGLITAEGREAQADFTTHLAEHGIEIKLHDVRVEGPSSVGEVVKAIQWFNENSPKTQVLVLTRGGGSLESLQSFNADEVARAIFASRIPVICAVGHEKDVSIADMVADVRASTPTDAAKILSESWNKASAELVYLADKIGSSLLLVMTKIESQLSEWSSQFRYSLDIRLGELASRLQGYEDLLSQANPNLKLSQGYSIVSFSNGDIVKTSRDIKRGDELRIKFDKGGVKTTVTDKHD